MSKRSTDYEQKTIISFNHKNSVLFVKAHYCHTPACPKHYDVKLTSIFQVLFQVGPGTGLS